MDSNPIQDFLSASLQTQLIVGGCLVGAALLTAFAMWYQHHHGPGAIERRKAERQALREHLGVVTVNEMLRRGRGLDGDFPPVPPPPRAPEPEEKDGGLTLMGKRLLWDLKARLREQREVNRMAATGVDREAFEREVRRWD